MICNPFDCGRRPEVIESWFDSVIEYAPAEDDDEDQDDDECCYCDEKESLDESWLDPYVPIEKDYYIAIGDVFEISIFEDDETTVQNVVVAPDGRIYYAFINGIYAKGKTIPQVRRELSEELSKINLYNNPIVTMALRQSESATYKILGRIQRPGLYYLYSPIRLRDAIALAGGLSTEFYRDKTTPLQQIANLEDSFIVRNNRKLDVDFEKLYYESDSNQNIFLRPGDYIYIATYEMRQVFVLGDVKIPIAMPWRRDLTFMGAIAYAGAWAGGYPSSPNIHKALVLRGSLDDPEVIFADISKIISGEAKDFYVRPKDIIYLPNKEFRFVRELVRLAAITFIQAFGSAAGSYYGGTVLFHVGTTNATDSTE